MPGIALSSIGVKFGYGLGTATVGPVKWEQIEECVSIGGVELSQDKIDATPLESKTKKYVAGHEDTGGELETVFNVSDTFDAQWEKMLAADKAKSSGQVMWFCAYHPSRAKMTAYIVSPGSRPVPEYSVGNVLQYTIKNTLIDLPPEVTKSEPTVTEAP